MRRIPVQRRLGDPAARQLLRRDGRRRGAVAAGDAAARRRTRPGPRRRPHGAGDRLLPRRRVRVPEDVRRARGVPRQACAAGVRGRLPRRDGLRERRARRAAAVRLLRLLRRRSTPTCATARTTRSASRPRAHQDSRWYSGAGIYRDTVHLVVGDAGAHRPRRRPGHHARRRRRRSRSSRSRRRSRTTAADSRTRRRASPRSATPTARSSRPTTSPVTVLPGRARRRAAAALRRATRRCGAPDAPALYTAPVDPAGRRRRRRRRHGRPSASGPCRSTRSAACGSTARRSKLRGACIHHDNGAARRGDDRPRRGAPGRAAQGGRLQRHPQRAQPDEPGDARRLRPARHARHGRDVRHVDREQEPTSTTRSTSPSGGSATSRRWCARTSTTRA